MNWPDAEAAIRTHIETNWTGMTLAWENEAAVSADTFMFVAIEGVYADKTLYGGTGKRTSVQAGIVHFHAFIPLLTGKAVALDAVADMTALLELRVLNDGISFEGGNPPSPVEAGPDDRLVPAAQPGGLWYRCSGSVPFVLIGSV